jgi:hypothetical protein
MECSFISDAVKAQYFINGDSTSQSIEWCNENFTLNWNLFSYSSLLNGETIEENYFLKKR